MFIGHCCYIFVLRAYAKFLVELWDFFGRYPKWMFQTENLILFSLLWHLFCFVFLFTFRLFSDFLTKSREIYVGAYFHVTLKCSSVKRAPSTLCDFSKFTEWMHLNAFLSAGSFHFLVAFLISVYFYRYYICFYFCTFFHNLIICSSEK